MISRRSMWSSGLSLPRLPRTIVGLCALGCAPVAAPPASTPAAPAQPQAASGAPAPAEAPAAAAAQEPAAPAPGEPAEPKFDFEGMLARERPAAKLLPVTDPKGRWRSAIESRRAPLVVNRGDHVSVRALYAAKDEVRCEVHEGQLNPGVTVANLLTAASQNITLEEAAVYHVGSAHEAPVLFARARYKTRATPPLGGEIKVGISPGADYSIVCIHDEPGYRDAFVRTVEGFVSAFEIAQPVREPQYSAVWQYQVGDAHTGYSWERIYAEADGSVSSFTFDVMIAQLGSGELRVRDYLAAETHDRKGLSRGSFLSFMGTSKAHELQLTRTDAGPYDYKGNVAGKAVEGRLQPRAPLASGYERMLSLGKARAAKKLEWHQEEYRPERDPLHLSGADYTLDASHTALTRKAGAALESWELEDGLPIRSKATNGPNTFVGTLLSRRSSFTSEFGVTVGEQPEPDDAAALPLAERRRGFETHVFAETDHTPAKTPPAGVLSKVTYPAPLGANVAYVTPPRQGARRAAVVWIGGGLDWNIGESAWTKAPRDKDHSARAFRDAGLVLMLPALRGSNENPGKNECFFGEVDDLMAAADFLAARADVDPERIYLAGHATGGTLALLTAASTDRFRAAFVFSPVADARQYGTPTGGGCLPDNASTDDVALRAPINFVNSIRTPTFVFDGGVGGNADMFDLLRDKSSSALHFRVVPGVDASGLVAPATEVIAKAIAANQVDDAHLDVETAVRAGK